MLIVDVGGEEVSVVGVVIGGGCVVGGGVGGGCGCGDAHIKFLLLPEQACRTSRAPSSRAAILVPR